MRLGALSLAIFLLLSVASGMTLSSSATAPTQDLPPGSALTVQEIESAISLAKTEKVEPYQLSKRTTLGIKNDIFGYVYTPFIRVALTARVAFDAYRPFGPSDVPPQAVLPVIQIQSFSGEGPLGRVEPEHIVILRGRGTSDVIQPTSTNRAGTILAMPEVISPGPWLRANVRGDGFIATFPLSALEEGHEILLIYTEQQYGLGAGIKRLERKFKVEKIKWR